MGNNIPDVLHQTLVEVHFLFYGYAD